MSLSKGLNGWNEIYILRFTYGLSVTQTTLTEPLPLKSIQLFFS